MQNIFLNNELPLATGLARWLVREWRVLRFGALTLVAVLSPGMWDKTTRRDAAQCLCVAAWQAMPGYLLLTVLVTATLTRVIEVTAASYGLSHLALEAVVRVFVMELLPLATALSIATRSGLDAVVALAPLRTKQASVFQSESMRRIVALSAGNGLAMIALFVISGAVALAVAYLTAHGPSHWALPGFTRMIGQVFDPVTASVLAVKVALFALAVAMAPATVIVDTPRRNVSIGEMRVMARMLLMILCVEAASLAIKQVG